MKFSKNSRVLCLKSVCDLMPEDYVCGQSDKIIMVSALPTMQCHLGVMSTTMSDVHWFAHNLAKNLMHITLSPSTITGRISQAVYDLSTKYYTKARERGIRITGDLQFSVSILFIYRKQLYFWNLGNNMLVIQHNDNTIDRLWDASYAKECSLVLNKILIETRRYNKTITAAIRAHVPDIHTMLRSCNKQDSYKVLTPNLDSVVFGKLHTLNASDIKYMYLMSDGFYSYLDTFSFASNLQVFTNHITKYGLEEIADKIQKAQLKDKLCDNYPRIERSNDISAVSVKLEDVPAQRMI